MSLLPVDLGELINRPAKGPMRDEPDQVPNFTDHLDTISRDLILGRPKIVTLRSVREYDVKYSQCQYH
jgi:hypothetical protein